MAFKRASPGRRDFLKILASGTIAGLSVPFWSNLVATGESRPNVVVVVSEGHRWDMMSCSGNKFLRTRHFDRLAQEGCLFENAFTVAGVSPPAYACFLTSKYSHQCGVPTALKKNNSFLEHQRPFPVILHNAGYDSAYFGTWGFGDDRSPRVGFDHWVVCDMCNEPLNPTVWVNGKNKRIEGFGNDVISKLAAEFISARSKRDKPFCVIVSLMPVESPFAYPSRHEHLLDGIEITKPDSFSEDYGQSGRLSRLRESPIRIGTSKEGLLGFDSSWDKYVKSYYRAVQALDDALGEILRAVDDIGATETTVLIYVSNHGYSLGEHGLTSKCCGYEQVIRIPMAIRYPKAIKQGYRCKELVLNVDLAPTVISFCGLAVPRDASGQSLVPLLKNRVGSLEGWREDFLFEYWDNRPEFPAQLAVRTKTHKLIAYQYEPHMELYDLENDPYERVNVARNSEYAVTLTNMEKRLKRLKEKTSWSLRMDQEIKACFVIGPVSNVSAEYFGKTISSWRFESARSYKFGDGTFSWTKHMVGPDGRLHFTDAAADDVLFIAIPVERKTSFDPCALIWLDPGRSAKAYFNGKVIWEHSDDAALCNSPLSAADAFILLQVPASIPEGLKIILNAPLDSLKLL